MTDKIKDKKIGGIKSTTQTSGVEETGAVSGVKGVKPTTAVGGITGPGGISRRRSTRTMTLAEREQLFQIIQEEADKMLSGSGLPTEKRQAVHKAVKMAVDSSLIEEDEGKKP